MPTSASTTFETGNATGTSTFDTSLHQPDQEAGRAGTRSGCRAASRRARASTPSVAKMRRTSRPRAPMQRRMPISRVRSITFIVIAFARPTMLIATIRKPSTAIDVVIVRLAATLSASSTYSISVADLVAGGGERVLELRRHTVDETVVTRAPSSPSSRSPPPARDREDVTCGRDRDEQHRPVLLLVRGDADDAERDRAARSVHRGRGCRPAAGDPRDVPL